MFHLRFVSYGCMGFASTLRINKGVSKSLWKFMTHYTVYPYICIYVYMYVSICVYQYICILVCILISESITEVCIYIYVYICMCAQMCHQFYKKKTFISYKYSINTSWPLFHMSRSRYQTVTKQEPMICLPSDPWLTTHRYNILKGCQAKTLSNTFSVNKSKNQHRSWHSPDWQIFDLLTRQKRVLLGIFGSVGCQVSTGICFYP